MPPQNPCVCAFCSVHHVVLHTCWTEDRRNICNLNRNMVPCDERCPHYGLPERLRLVNVEGITFVVSYDNYLLARNIEPGDLYVAKRNRPWMVFECRRVNNHGWIHSTKFTDYPYDWHECYKVHQMVE